MNLLFKVLDFLGYSNLFLAFGAFCSTLQGSFLFSNSKESSYAFAIVNFSAAFTLYNAQRIYQSYSPKTDRRLLWYGNHNKLIYFIEIILFVLFAKFIFITFLTFKESIFVYTISGVISILYFLPPFEFRKLAFIKIFYIALIWVIVCTIIPLLFHGNLYQSIKYFTVDNWVYIFSQFFFIAAICIPFDIRDLDKDKADNVKSIPVLLGVNKSKVFGLILLLIYLVLAYFIEIKSLFPIRGIVFFISVIVLYLSQPSRHRYYYIYFADGLIILQTVLLYLFLN